jgi:hypothetical protein
MAAKKKKAADDCKCGTGAKAVRISNAGYHWKMCRVSKGSRTRKPGTFAKRAACD